jgi:hypothetical protein
MDVPASVARLGFRKWYERELIKSHLALVTCFLCGILVAALVETLELGRGAWKPVSWAMILAAVILGWMSWRSYITGLGRAERYGERSSCPACSSYGLFQVLESGIDPGRDAAARRPPLSWMKVQCRKCGAGWQMPD